MKIVTRYRNYQLYNSADQSYVNHSTLMGWIADGTAFKIRDSETGKNITQYLYDELEDTSDFDPDPITTRKCRSCGKCLPQSRYFKHATCSDGIVEAYGKEEYGGLVGSKAA